MKKKDIFIIIGSIIATAILSWLMVPSFLDKEELINLPTEVSVKQYEAGTDTFIKEVKVSSKEEIKDLLAAWRLEPLSVTFLKNAKHVFTHIDWLMQGWQVAVKEQNDSFLWVSIAELQSAYPLPTAFRKILSP